MIQKVSFDRIKEFQYVGGEVRNGLGENSLFVFLHCNTVFLSSWCYNS